MQVTKCSSYVTFQLRNPSGCRSWVWTVTNSFETLQLLLGYARSTSSIHYSLWLLHERVVYMHIYSCLNTACISYCGCKEKEEIAKNLKAATSDSKLIRVLQSSRHPTCASSIEGFSHIHSLVSTSSQIFSWWLPNLDTLVFSKSSLFKVCHASGKPN